MKCKKGKGIETTIRTSNQSISVFLSTLESFSLYQFHRIIGDNCRVLICAEDFSSVTKLPPCSSSLSCGPTWHLLTITSVRVERLNFSGWQAEGWVSVGVVGQQTTTTYIFKISVFLHELLLLLLLLLNK